MEAQNYSNHRRYVKGFHFVLGLMLIIGTICSIINLVSHPPNAGGHVSSCLILLLFVCSLLMSYFLRTFPIKAQDGSIRAEEGLRYYILTGKALDTRLTMGQIAALRFAPDEEFLPLLERTIAENLSPNEIKKSIKEWRADHHRV